MSHQVSSRAHGAVRLRRAALVSAVAAVTMLCGGVFSDAMAQNTANPGKSGKAASGWSQQAFPSGFAGAFIAAQAAERRGDFKTAAFYYRRALRGRPQDPQLMGAALRYSLMVGDVGPASSIADQVMELAGNHGAAPLVLAVEAIRSGDYDGARVMLDSGVAQIAPVLRDLLKGWAAFGAGDLDAAMAEFLQGHEDKAKKIFGNLHAGYLAMAQGDPASAATYFEASKDALGGWTRGVALSAATAYVAAGDQERAAAVLNDALETAAYDEALTAALKRLEEGREVLPPIATALEGSAAALVEISQALGTERKDTAELGLVYAQLARAIAPQYDQAVLLAGERLSELEQYELAAAAFADVPRSSAFTVEARYARAIAKARADDVDEAIRLMNGLIDEGARAPDLLVALGSFALGEERYAECSEAYEQAIVRLKELFGGELQAQQWSVYFRAGICRERSGEWDAAEAHFEAALALNPGQADVLNYYGYSLVEQKRRLVEARDMIERAALASPQSGHIIDSLGWVLWRMGDFEGAVRELARAIALEPTVYEINDHYGDALWMVGRKREARFHWRRALTFKPEDPEVIARIERKLEIGLDAVLAEEGLTPPQTIEESAAPGGEKAPSEAAPNDG